MYNYEKIFSELKFDKNNLIPVIVQQFDSKEVLMMAWMNKEALKKTLESNLVYYFSRSRNKIWKKGETSKQFQNLKELVIDCDGDTILAIVDQVGVACHTGRKNCFFKTVTTNGIKINQDIIVNPKELYNE